METPEQPKKGAEKWLLVLPVIVLLASLAFLGSKFMGEGLNLDIDLKGGTQIIYDTSGSVDASAIESLLGKYDASVRTAKGPSGTSVIIEFGSSIDEKEVMTTLEEGGYGYKLVASQTVGSTLGSSFFSQAAISLAVAFLLMAVTVFILFRVPMPSLYVVLAGFADIVETLAISQLLGINLSLATFAALLLLIGYSVDTDVLLTYRVMRRVEGTVDERIRGARTTGLTMTFSAIVATLAMMFFSSSAVISQIASVLTIGLVLDIMNTWITNAYLLKWYMARRGP